jgi:DNA polymerase-3 subunit gamma/tau
MSYLVLARKWRPKRFSELVGQEHVVKALSNALDTGRVHHAFLFTGTRGVGKTTIARIFAKSLNCERGSGAEPCGECAACLDIDAGRFVDLLEIDAASNTGVDDVRALIENAQYMPARGRTKVYLIDEVHMLSKNAFNALLKTLEEPPGHVKFLLATTDPQKLPVTVLSRCLQFNLRRLEPAQIEGQMAHIMQAEGIGFEPGALQLLARAADGSLRDGLSLLDQAIAHTGSGQLDESGVNAMLGTVERARVGDLLDALAAGDAGEVMREVAELAQYSPDFGQLLEDLASELHRVQLHQLVPGFTDEGSRVDATALAGKLSPELVQLWFQMALNGRRDLGLAPSARAGLEMTLLRMLAFRPASGEGASAAHGTVAAARPAAPPPRASAAPVREFPSPAEAPVQTPAFASAPTPSAPTAPSFDANTAPMPLASAEDWLALVSAAGLKGPALQLGSHCQFCGYADGVLRLHLPDEDAHLRNDSLVRQLSTAAAQRLGRDVRLLFEGKPSQAGDTLHARTQRERSEKQSAAEASFLSDPVVAQLLGQGGSIVPDSIRPLSEN